MRWCKWQFDGLNWNLSQFPGSMIEFLFNLPINNSNEVELKWILVIPVYFTSSYVYFQLFLILRQWVCKWKVSKKKHGQWRWLIREITLSPKAILFVNNDSTLVIDGSVDTFVDYQVHIEQTLFSICDRNMLAHRVHTLYVSSHSIERRKISKSK